MNFLILGAQFLFGLGLLTWGLFFTKPGELTGDGLPLNIFLVGIGIFFTGLASFLYFSMYGIIRLEMMRRDFYLSKGTRLKAKLLKKRSNGILVNQRYLVKLVYEVNGKQHSSSKLLWPWEVSQLQVGQEIVVYLHPDKKKYYLEI